MGSTKDKRNRTKETVPSRGWKVSKSEVSDRVLGLTLLKAFLGTDHMDVKYSSIRISVSSMRAIHSAVHETKRHNKC